MTTSRHLVLLLLVPGFASPATIQAQRASTQLNGSPTPVPLRVIIRPLPNSPLLRVCSVVGRQGTLPLPAKTAVVLKLLK